MDRRQFISTAAKTALGAAICAQSKAYSATDSNWKIGIYTRPWAKHDYRTALDEMVEIGFKYAGIMTHKKGLVIGVKTKERTAAKVGREAQDRGLQIISVYGGEFNADRSVKAGINGLKKLVDNVAACDGKNLLLGGTGDRKVYNNYYKAVRETCDYAANQGVVITLKPHGGLNATGPQCRKTVETIGHPNFQLWYDPGNIYYYSDGELDPLVDVVSVEGSISGMCVKDYKHPKEVMVTPGKGKVNFPTLFKKLHSTGFTCGPLVIECLDDGSISQTKKEALSAKTFLEEITGKLR
jgi:sugar phosphate isomerase/epimerase